MMIIGNNIGQEGAKALASSLAQLQELYSLSLNGKFYNRDGRFAGVYLLCLLRRQ